jgi:hypothetical protein
MGIDPYSRLYQMNEEIENEKESIDVFVIGGCLIFILLDLLFMVF